MTRIRFDWGKLELTESGHAGGGIRGEDIICAGISAISMALLNAVREYLEDGKEVDWEMKNAEGYLRIRAKPNAINRDIILNFYEMAYIGLKAIEQKYPENVKIEEVEDSGSD